MIDAKISILIVNFNSSQFVELILYALEKLTKNPFKVFILDNGSEQKDYDNLLRITGKYKNVFAERWNKKFESASMAHGTALNYLVKKVDTPYFSILDADATWLKKNWDEILISKINESTKVIGTQASIPKPQDFPLMFAILFETETFKKLEIDFRPKNQDLRQDTGFEMREKYLANDYSGLNLELRNTRSYKKGPFGRLVCAEYYLEGTNEVFASHFGRGSTLGANKYSRDWKKYAYGIPILGKKILQKKGLREKKQWITTCKAIVDNQD